MKEWIVVASRTRARILTRKNKLSPLNVVDVLENEAGRMRDHDFETERPGLAFAKFGGSPSPHSLKFTSQHERMLRQFCKKIAHYLELHYLSRQFDNLIIFCEPHMMGTLKNYLAKQKLKLSGITWIPKDLNVENLQQIRDRLTHFDKSA